MRSSGCNQGFEFHNKYSSELGIMKPLGLKTENLSASAKEIIKYHLTTLITYHLKSFLKTMFAKQFKTEIFKFKTI